jgi:two-component system, OmpR family, sensor kinase
MIKSLRWRLQLWYAALLLTVVGGYGSILYYQTCASKLQEIDAARHSAQRTRRQGAALVQR